VFWEKIREKYESAVRQKIRKRVLRERHEQRRTAHTHLAAAKNDDGIKDKDAFSLFSHFFLHFFFPSVVSRASQNEEARCSEDDVSLSSFLLRARIFVLDW